jgi:hypothetical protein
MNQKIVYLGAFVFLLLLLVGTASAQSQIGVSPGNSFTYAVTSNSNVPLIYQILNSPKDVMTLKVTIQSITPPNKVTLNMTQQFKNGTQTSWIEDKDLTSASNFPITFANLNTNDSLWSNEPLSPKVNETVTQNYQAGSREINHARVESTESGYDLVEYSFDRATGMLVEVSFVESSQVSTVLKLAESTVWTIPEFSTPMLVILLVSLTLVIGVLYKKRR